MGCDDRPETSGEEARRKREAEAERLLVVIQTWKSDRLSVGELLFLASKTRAFTPTRVLPVRDFSDEDLKILREIFKRHDK